jgi:hypothetical protein
MNAPVTEFIDKLPQVWQADLCRQLRGLVYQAIPDADERIQYGKPHYKKNNKYAAVISTAKAFVSFTIFNAQGITPPEGMFESSDTGDRKTIKIKEGQAIDEALLVALLTQAANTL